MAAIVRAGGGLVVRRLDDRSPELLLVHRPRYDDWSFPKGKAVAGESDEACALREVEEESGLRCALGVPLGVVEYADPRGRPKVVRYWTMRPLGPGRPPTPDVDGIRWLRPREAEILLSYERDRHLLGLVTTGPLFVVAHGSAGTRAAWRGDDRDRPLDRRGRGRAERLASLLAGRPVERVLTSPYRRCVETARPTAAALGLPLEEREELAEGVSAAVALSAAVRGALLCTHPDVAARLVGRGPCGEGAAWVARLSDGVVQPVEYLPPPS